MPATARFAAAAGTLQHPDALGEIPVLGKERIGLVDDDLVGRDGGWHGGLDGWHGCRRRLRNQEPDDEGQCEQDAGEPRA